MTRTWIRRLAVACGLIVALGLLWVLFFPLATSLGGNDLRALNPKDRLDALSTIRNQIGAVLSAAAVGGGLYYTARKFFLDRDKQFTDRFNTAIDHLGASDEVVRAGGVRALDRILRDSATDRDRVLESLTGFLRTHTANNSDATTGDDITAAIAVLRNRPRPGRRTKESPLDLRGTRLPRANLAATQLRGANLTGAELTSTTLRHAALDNARLASATLIDADLTGVTLTSAVLTGARLTRATLTTADLSDADLTNADLTRTDLDNTVLTNTNLTNTNLKGANLSQAVGVTNEQLTHAQVDEHTLLPQHINHTIS
jgi:uncharacterized protein YjbI with pentapeptide repeats